MNKLLYGLLAASCLTLLPGAHAAPVDDAIVELQREWEVTRD